MSLNVPLKVKNSDGDLQLFTTTEENYLAHQLGLKLATATTSSPASISTDSSNATLIGSFTDTFFNEPVGTSESTGLSVGTIITPLYQKDGLGDSSSSNFRITVGYGVGDNGIREMADSDHDTFIDRLLTKTFLNDFPGTYKLDSAGFSNSDYIIHISNVFTDNQTDGTTKNYHIFKRNTMSTPAAVRPVAVRRSSGKSGNFIGLQELNDTQIRESLGQQAISRISIGGIGKYKLRNSAEGIPSPGTWVAKGIAVDTRKNVEDVNYSKERIETFSTTFTGVFTDQYTGVYSKQYTDFYTKQYTKQYTGDYGLSINKSFTGQYTGNRFFGGQVNKSYVRQYTGNRFFGGQVNKSYVRQYTGARSFLGFRLQYFTGTRQFTGTVSQIFSGTFTGTRQFSGARPQFFASQFTGTRTFTGSYTGIRSIPGATGGTINIVLGFTGYFTRTSQFTSPTYKRENFGTFSRTESFSGQYTGSRSSQFSGARSFLGLRSFYFTGLRTFSRTYVGQYTRQFVSSAQFSRTYVGQYTRQFVKSDQFSRTYVGQYTRQFIGQFSRQYTAEYAAQFTGLYSRTRTESYVGSYIGQYVAEYISQYAGITISSEQETIETYTLYVNVG